MDSSTTTEIVALYNAGHTIREIVEFLGGKYQREAVRCALQRGNANVRGRKVKFKVWTDMTGEDKELNFFLRRTGSHGSSLSNNSRTLSLLADT
jgi:hypothetical protein